MLNGYVLQNRYKQYKAESKDSSINKKKKIEKAAQLREELTNNYKIRINQFLTNMVMNPVVVQDFVSIATEQFRSNQGRRVEDDDEIMEFSKPKFATRGIKSERQRIRETIESNKLLASDPIKNHMCNHEFRSRDTSKEIQPKMRFTAKTGIERVYDQVKESEKFVHTQNILKMAKLKILKKKNSIETDEDYNSQSDMDIQEKIDKKRHKTEIPITSILAKSLRPDLHLKTHFQTVSSIYNGQSKILNNKWNEKGMEMGEVLERIKEHKVDMGIRKESAEILNKSNSTDFLFKNVEQPIPRKFLSNRGSEENNNYPELGIDSTNPLKKGRNDGYNPEIYKYLTEINGRGRRKEGLIRWLSPENERKIRKCPIIEERENPNSTKKIAGEVLVICNMKRRPKSPQILRKGQGHLMIGFGENNKILESRSNIGSAFTKPRTLSTARLNSTHLIPQIFPSPKPFKPRNIYTSHKNVTFRDTFTPLSRLQLTTRQTNRNMISGFRSVPRFK